MKTVFRSTVLALLVVAASAIPAAAQDAIVPDDFATINAAVAGAADGDASGTIDIFVRAGTYVENVFVRRDAIALTGEDATTTTIQGTGVRDTVSVRADDTLIEGFTVVASGAFDSIDIQRSTGTVVQGNLLTGGGSGVRVSRSRSVQVSDNEVFGTSQEGIKFDRSRRGVVMANFVHDNVGEGISFDDSGRMRVQLNDVMSNGSNGIRDRAGSRSLFRSNQSIGNGGNGFDVEDSSANVLDGNTASGNLSNGLRMKGTSDHLVTLNAFTDNVEWGIRRENWLNDDFDGAAAGVQDPPGDNDVSGNGMGGVRED